jgi:hypothetical protein
MSGATHSFTANPVATDISTTKLIFAQLRKESKEWLCRQELENSLVAYEINKGVPPISFGLCMLISEYLDPSFVKQDIFAEGHFEDFCRAVPYASIILGITNAMMIMLLGTFGSEQQKAQIVSDGSSLGSISLKMGLVTSVGYFAFGKAVKVVHESKVIEKIKKVFER